MIRAWLESRRDDVDLAVYGAVATIGPASGPEIGHHAGMRPGTVSASLDRLERRGWVSGSWEQPVPLERRARRLYALGRRGSHLDRPAPGPFPDGVW